MTVAVVVHMIGSRPTLGRMSDAPQFFYNLRTGQVEDQGTKGQSKDLLGPYPTREAAENALERARERTETWDEEDRRWSEGD